MLLVDDRAENLLALEATLEPLGVVFVRATSAEEALQAVLAEDFAVILLDVQMPNTDGVETARLIKGREASRVTPIIFLTALDHDRRHVTEGYESGAVDYLFKPVDVDVLRAKVAAFVSLFERREQELLQQRHRYADLSAESERALREASAMGDERLRLAYEAERRARATAEEANRAKSQFLATMSHEIRTPINAVLGYTSLLELGVAGPVTGQQKDYLSRLRMSSHHLLGLINEVLDLSKTEAGQMSVTRQTAFTGEAVAAAMAITLPQAEAKGIRMIDMRAGELGEPYIGDEKRVRQIVVNLLSNAIKFTPPGGTITISCRRTQEPTSPPSAHLSGRGPWACIRVEDTGIGIAPDEQERVFEPFVQGVAGLTRTVGGTGLGLTISRRLAHLMDGDLTVESHPGAGSVFMLCLPAGAPEALSERSSAQPLRGEPPAPKGLAAMGAYVRERVERIMEEYVERLRRDPIFPSDVRTTVTAQLEDHAATLLTDLAQSLVAIEETGGPQSDLLRDGTEIQRFVSELHAQQRVRMGWTEAHLTRDLEHLADAVEAVVRRKATQTGEVDTSVRVLRQLISVASIASHRAFRLAAQAAPE